ncbi:hypothetical protein [uncultured Clostridium sp.]|uniref:hypothetical protein n=1 Tax=uncultured Clostridium sp. TaxID=59620 RepID=UPI0025CE3B57|nr:hypothetical protein [uncultured Clostridium sp.]MDU4883101.1 hypothetical protein [Clostridium celatum]MDU7076179.1 hypothetical protein [Clostridium celatum]
MSYIPKSIELLFKNFKLDTARALVIIYVISNGRKKIKVKEYIYYELQNVLNNKGEFEELFEGRYTYFKINSEIEKIILYLSNINCISIASKNIKNVLDLEISITDKGRKLVSNLKDIYYKRLIDNIFYIKSEKKYSNSEYKRLLEVINEWG